MFKAMSSDGNHVCHNFNFTQTLSANMCQLTPPAFSTPDHKTAFSDFLRFSTVHFLLTSELLSKCWQINKRLFINLKSLNYSQAFDTLQNDIVIVLALKLCFMIFILFLAAWIKKTENFSESTIITIDDANLKISDRNCSKKSTLKCQNGCGVSTSKNQTNNDVCLEVEEKKRHKKFTHKRKCLSAGPILITLRRKKPKNKKTNYVNGGAELIVDFKNSTSKADLRDEHHITKVYNEIVKYVFTFTISSLFSIIVALNYS